MYLLWNGVLTHVVDVRSIGYWQALGLLVLSRILFGRLPGSGGRGGPWGRRRMMRRWASLSPDERARLREEMRQRFGEWPRPPWCDEPPEGSQGPGEAKA